MRCNMSETTDAEVQLAGARESEQGNLRPSLQRIEARMARLPAEPEPGSEPPVDAWDMRDEGGSR